MQQQSTQCFFSRSRSLKQSFKILIKQETEVYPAVIHHSYAYLTINLLHLSNSGSTAALHLRAAYQANSEVQKSGVSTNPK